MNFRLLALAAAAALPFVLPAVQHANAAGPSVCMTDEGYGRFRPCDSFYKASNPNWRGGDNCFTDEGYGRYRPCDSFYKAKHQAKGQGQTQKK